MITIDGYELMTERDWDDVDMLWALLVQAVERGAPERPQQIPWEVLSPSRRGARHISQQVARPAVTDHEVVEDLLSKVGSGGPRVRPNAWSRRCARRPRQAAPCLFGLVQAFVDVVVVDEGGTQQGLGR